MNTHNNTLTTTPMIRYSGTVKSETEYGTVFMKNSRVLLILFASILLLIPTASPRAAAVSITLTPGTTSLIGTVDVSTLPQTDQSSVNMNQAPLHSQASKPSIRPKRKPHKPVMSQQTRLQKPLQLHQALPHH